MENKYTKTSLQGIRNVNVVLAMILFTVLSLMNSTKTMAQTPMFYNSFTVSSSNVFPLGSTTNKVQWIYGPTLFNSNGNSGTPAYYGSITKIYFQLGSTVVASTYTNFSISLAQNVGTQSAWLNNTYATGLTTSFGPTTYTLVNPLANQWYGIQLTTPFSYDPTLSLIFEMKTNSTGGTQVNQQGSTNQRIYGVYDNSTGSATGAGLVNFGFDEAPQPACTTPTAQPTNLSLTAASTTSINGTFTGASGNPTNYLVVRYLHNVAPTAPVNTTTYIVGGSLGAGTIISTSNSTSFSSTGLSPGTQYDYYVYSFNFTSGNCSPAYLLTSPLNGTQSTLSCGGFSGIRSVGPTGFYASLTAAMVDIANNGINGPAILELQSTYNSNVETYPINFPLNVCMGPVNK